MKSNPKKLWLTFACARELISAEAFITSTSYSLFTLRNAPTSGESDFRFEMDVAEAMTSKYEYEYDDDPISACSPSLPPSKEDNND